MESLARVFDVPLCFLYILSEKSNDMVINKMKELVELRIQNAPQKSTWRENLPLTANWS